MSSQLNKSNYSRSVVCWSQENWWEEGIISYCCSLVLLIKTGVSEQVNYVSLLIKHTAQCPPLSSTYFGHTNSKMQIYKWQNKVFIHNCQTLPNTYTLCSSIVMTSNLTGWFSYTLTCKWMDTIKYSLLPQSQTTSCQHWHMLTPTATPYTHTMAAFLFTLTFCFVSCGFLSTLSTQNTLTIVVKRER